MVNGLKFSLHKRQCKKTPHIFHIAYYLYHGQLFHILKGSCKQMPEMLPLPHSNQRIDIKKVEPCVLLHLSLSSTWTCPIDYQGH